MGGLDGIKRKLKAPDPVEENIYELTKEQREERGIGPLPGSLDEALAALKQDTVITIALGEHFFKPKSESSIEYHLAVTPWEIERYLEDY